MVFRFGGVDLTGINKLKDKHAGQTAVICCSGTTFNRYDNTIPPSEWPRFAVNETIRKTSKYADFWVFSDEPIIFEYKDFCQKATVCLAMRQAVKQKKHLPSEYVYTVDSMAEPKSFNNGFQFYSRGTVMIGAIEMARFMGFTRFFIFGLDCYRTKEAYYYDGRKPIKFSENKIDQHEMLRTKEVPANLQLFVTSLLRKMINRLELGAPLWKDIELYCVDSLYSQQTVAPKMSLEEFKALVEKEKKSEAKEPDNARQSCTPLRTQIKAAKAEVATPVSKGNDERVGEDDVGSDPGAGERKVRSREKTGVSGAGDTARDDNEIDGSGSARPAAEKLLRVD